MNESSRIYSPHRIDVAVDWCMAILLQKLGAGCEEQRDFT